MGVAPRSKRYAEMASEEKSTPMERASSWLEIAKHPDYDGHDSELAKHLRLVSASFDPTPSHPHNATSVFELIVPHTLCNMSGNLHGGAVALIFDICTSITINILAKPEFWDSGHVTRTLNCTYLRPVQEGQKVLIESQVVHLGKRMGVVTGVIRGTEEDGGKVCYTCEHGKASLTGSNM
ncbi:hypothetical protein GQ43DRAFT_493586 [Delitschia confertaspora ATCC 74209]|uniref:Thioesterase domain-containing protein n=1 Tax=Delitschia confertaspora ATCC 74209 TaxID=1513339 RepID=A0A9P4N3K7_9PLEO|nr:hypothetical protein GQ43DRAFT_493586 [Delitschia confertaspora ATCC 74209]